MKYTAKDHAYVYGVIAQELLNKYPNALFTLEKAIKVYGLQRGSRMGQTADLYGDPRTMQTYLAYGEWAPAPGEMDIVVTRSSPSAEWHVMKCPWSQEWAEQGMNAVGKYYCQFVDRELVHGYNPQLELGTGTTQTAGDPYCYFQWTGADMTAEHIAENAAIANKVGTVRLKTWAYHMGHIYKTMGCVIEETLGKAAYDAVYGEADRRLENRYGSETVQLMHAGLLLDYWVTPSLKSTGYLKEMFEE